ncbi:MAG: hypothetical protein ACJ79E_15030 [Anaeromyxobacteraceae bacterium]
MRRTLAPALALAALVGPASARAADGYRVPGEAQKAFAHFEEAAGQLARARAALAALDAGEPVKGEAQDWSGAPAALVAAADALRRSPGLALPDLDDHHPVAPRQLRSCGSRAEAIAVVERRRHDLLAAAQRGLEARAPLKEHLAAAQAADEARRFLVQTAARHAGEPALAQAFSWSWPDLEEPAAAALQSYTSELRRQLERVDRSVAEGRAQAAAAADLVAPYAHARDCLVAGSWSGTRTQAGAVSGFGLQLTNAGEAWSGAAILDGASVEIRSVAVNGSAVTIGLADGRGSLAGTLSADGRALKGTLSTLDGPAPFQLRKAP